MLIRKGYRFRLKPTGSQETLFRKTAGACRFVYNSALFHRQRHYEKTGTSLWSTKQSRRITELKIESDMAWLGEVPSHCLQQSLRDLDAAFSNFFEDLKKADTGEIKSSDVRRPASHKKGNDDSFRFPDPLQFRVDSKRVKLPKAGWVKFVSSQTIQGKPKSVTVSRDGKHWYMSVLCEQEVAKPTPPTGSAVGIDLNVEAGAAVALSDGRCLETSQTSKREKRHQRNLNRILARRKKGSANWHKAKDRLAKFQKYVADRRKDGLHKVTTDLAKNHGVIVIEDLNVKNMTASAKGTIDAPGRNVKAKSGLNRAVLDRGFGMFRQFLSYKCDWSSAKLVKVNPAYTSQRCSACGHTCRNNRRTTSAFSCVACGYSASAHLNAAKNILADGQSASVCGETVRPAVVAGNLVKAETHRGVAA